MSLGYGAQIRILDPAKLELFIKDWLLSKQNLYHIVETWAGTGDMGRDVVGYVTPLKHGGPWDNYQSKQLGSRLSERSAFVELGKIFFHSANGAYDLPRQYYFVAPTGVVREVKRLVSEPALFRQAFYDRWNQHCAPNIVEGKFQPLTDAIKAKIAKFDFTQVFALDAAGLADDPECKPALHKWFDYPLSAAPAGVVPAAVQTHEIAYLNQLSEVYGLEAAVTFSNIDDVLNDPKWAPQMRRQRERYFDAEEFKRFYRDSVFPDQLETLEEDVYHGVIDTFEKTFTSRYERLVAVLSHASTLSPSGALAKHARVPVKEGLCHHYANVRKMPWNQ